MKRARLTLPEASALLLVLALFVAGSHYRTEIFVGPDATEYRAFADAIVSGELFERRPPVAPW